MTWGGTTRGRTPGMMRGDRRRKCRPHRRPLTAGVPSRPLRSGSQPLVMTVNIGNIRAPSRRPRMASPGHRAGLALRSQIGSKKGVQGTNFATLREEKVGGFCCPVPPVPLESPSVARRGPAALLS